MSRLRIVDAATLERALRRRDNPSASRIDRQHMAFKLPSIGCAAGSCNELLSHNYAHVLERGEEQMKALQIGVCGRISERFQ